MASRNKMILLFGMPRSGTTWVGKIFDSHPDTLYMHEPDSWLRPDKVPLFIDGEFSEDDGEYLKKYALKISTIKKVQVTSKLPIFKKNYQTHLRYRIFQLSLYSANLLHKIGIVINPISRFTRASDSFVTIWKSIESLGRLPVLVNVLEDAYCVHILRNPAGYIASVMSGELNNKFQSSTLSSEDYNLFQMLLDTGHGQKLGYNLDQLKKLDPVEKLAIRWRLFNEISFDACKKNKNYTLLEYENLCREPVGVAKRLFLSAGLGWDGRVEKFVRASVTNKKDAYYSVYKDPLDAANKWRNILSKSDIKKIANILHGSSVFSFYEKDFKNISS